MKDQQLRPSMYEQITSRLHLIWLAIVGPVAFCLVFLTPPFQVPDETNHFLRSGQVAIGTWSGTRDAQGRPGGMIPAAMGTFLGVAGFHQMPFHRERKIDSVRASETHPSQHRWNDQRVFACNFNTIVYPPTGYLVPALGFRLGMGIGLSVLESFYLARLFVCASCLLLGFFAIRQTMSGKWLLALALSLPMSLFLFASLSQDAGLIAATALAVALLSRDGEAGGNRFSTGGMIGVAALLSFAMFAKPPYAAFFAAGFALLFIGDMRKRLWTLLVLAVTALGCMTLWLHTIHPLMSFTHREGIDVSKQLAWVLQHPIDYLGIFWRTLSERSDFNFTTAVGILGWLDAPIPSYLFPVIKCVLGFWLMIGVGFYFAQRRSLLRWFVALIGAAGSVFLISFMLYLSWNDVGGPMIEGVQGRYYIPVLIMCGLLVRDIKPGTSRLGRSLAATSALATLGFIGLTALTTCFTVIERYYY